MAVMEIACQETPVPTIRHPKELLGKAPQDLTSEKKSCVCKVEVPDKHVLQGPWKILSDVIAKGTAKEDSEKESLASISIIAQAECEISQEFSPTYSERHFIADTKQFSRSSSLDQIPNNVAHATEGKMAPAYWKAVRHGKSRKKRRKKRSRIVTSKGADSSTQKPRTPEQESCIPIPVQENDSHVGMSWHSASCKELGWDFSSFEKPSQVLPAGKVHLLKNQTKLELYKLISPAQCLSHVQGSPTQDNFFPQSETLHPLPCGKFPPPFYGYEDLLPVLRPVPLGAYLFDDLSRADGKCVLSDQSLEPNFSKCSHQSVKNTSNRLSIDEFLVDALKGSVILGEPRHLASLAKTWTGGGMNSKVCLQDMDENEGVLLTEEVINASLREGRVPTPLKEAVIRPILKKASLEPEVAANYRLVANILFLGKVLEQVVAGQLQAFLDETDYLDPFQSSFKPGYGTKSALVALYNDLCRERDGECIPVGSPGARSGFRYH
ncbi:Mitogen-activated protein kinase kinase kinase 14 [Varanus komodoensis]|nr:Mitogen-activated protein kinase kinase kinase 14 [Varanus komodoensis]